MDVLDPKSPYEKIYIVRSLVATREIGFLPGDHDESSAGENTNSHAASVAAASKSAPAERSTSM